MYDPVSLPLAQHLLLRTDSLPYTNWLATFRFSWESVAEGCRQRMLESSSTFFDIILIHTETACDSAGNLFHLVWYYPRSHWNCVWQFWRALPLSLISSSFTLKLPVTVLESSSSFFDIILVHTETARDSAGKLFHFLWYHSRSHWNYMWQCWRALQLSLISSSFALKLHLTVLESSSTFFDIILVHTETPCDSAGKLFHFLWYHPRLHWNSCLLYTSDAADD